MSEIGYGFLLMLVGMLTVFTILLFLILIGKGLIWFVNRYLPENELNKGATISVEISSSSAISDQLVAVINSAVSMVTRGQGRVISIKSLKK